MASQLDQLQATLQQEVSSKLGSAAGNFSIGTPTISSLQSTVTGSVTSQLSSAGNLLNNGVSGLTSSLSELSSSVFGHTSNATSALTNRSQSQDKGEQAVNSKITSLASDAAEAINKPVAFVTKSINDVVTGATTTVQNSGIKDTLSSMTDSAKNALSAATGTVIDSTSSVASAIKSVTNSFSEAVKSGTETLKQLKESTVAPIVSTVKDTVGSLTTGIQETIGSLNLNEITSSISDLNQTVLDSLPSSVSKFISAKETDFINSTIQKVTDGKAKQITSLLNSLSGINSNDVISAFLNLGSSSYPSIADESGGDVTRLYGNQNLSTTQRLLNAANTICHINDTTGSYLNYATNKSLYDVLLGLAGEYGISSLIDGLSNCGKTGNASYFDSRSISVLQKVCETSATNGDPVTYQSAQNAAGTANVTTNSDQLVKLNVNMKDNADDVSTYYSILNSSGTTVSKLTTATTIGSNTIYDSSRVGVMCASNTTVMDSAIGSDNRNLIQQLITSY